MHIMSVPHAHSVQCNLLHSWLAYMSVCRNENRFGAHHIIPMQLTPSKWATSSATKSSSVSIIPVIWSRSVPSRGFEPTTLHSRTVRPHFIGWTQEHLYVSEIRREILKFGVIFSFPLFSWLYFFVFKYYKTSKVLIICGK